MWNELFISPGGHSQRSCCQELCVSDLDWVGGPHCYYCQCTITSFGSFSVNHALISSIDSIDDNMQVKITDNALARDLFPMDYHCLGDNENRPVRWMALESLLNNDFSSLSDVVTSSVPYTVWNNEWISAICGLDKVALNAFDTFSDNWLRCWREGSSTSLFPVRISRHVWDRKLNRSGEKHTVYTLFLHLHGNGVDMHIYNWNSAA